MPLNDIVVQGAREHNLKGIDLTVPRGTLTTVTGVSGSGKSSLAFDTIFQEGQRRFVESLSAYARQFLGNLDKPRVDRVDGLSPTISIDQKTVNRNPRSTVGTITEIYDHLRLLLARLGEAHCPGCDRLLAAQTRDQMADRLLEAGAGQGIQILAPIVQGRKGEYRKELESLRLKGFVRARIDGEICRLDEEIRLSRYKKHTIEVVVDRVKATPERLSRIAEALETALQLANGVAAALVGDEHMLFSSRLACPDCGSDFPELEPRLFSFNSPYGACDACSGLGQQKRFDEALLIPDPALSIREGAIQVMSKKGYLAYARLGPESLEKVARTFRFSLDQPWSSMTRAQQEVLLFGSGERKVKLEWEYEDQQTGRKIKGRDHRPIRGVLPAMARFYRVTKATHLERYMAQVVCAECDGSRLRTEARAVRFREKNICELSGMTVGALSSWFEKITLSRAEEPIGRELHKEIRSRLSFLVDVGLSYLPLDRGARTLSGGEAQRVRLATQVGSQLQGVLYVLDEPSIGLHQRDNQKLLDTLHRLRDRGNTVLVVEHDRDTMLASDYLVDVGPGAGQHGGEVVTCGTPAEVFRHPTSRTACFLRGECGIEMPARSRRRGQGAELLIRGARQHNLKDIDVAIPLGQLVAVTGVSGSGKSTLINLVLKRALARRLHNARDRVGEHDGIDGVDRIDKVIEIDQAPIGRTPRSNPATYSGAFTHIRELFTRLPESRLRGYKKGRFSFNVTGGRCEECFGAGVRIVEMQFLADVEIPCDECAGQRYNDETLEVVFKGQNINQVLDMTVDQAAGFFAAHPKLHRILKTLKDVGLGYVHLGQTATTLSGGEAQRLKLASELARPGTGSTLYLLDEPTTGLHIADIERLLDALDVLVEAGNTVVVIEHNLDVVKVADHVIDLGPEGGEGGGQVVFVGTPRQAMRRRSSWTGRLLKEYVKPVQLTADGAGLVREATDAGGGQALEVRGASIHNLKQLDSTIPHGSLTVVTGVSGSGKTSLAFDTIFAEAQRRFVESMSTYARRFLSRLDRAPVERISGLSPAIAIDRKTPSRNPRSTVATSTEIYDYLRVLFARVGIPHCPECGLELSARPPGVAAREAVKQFSGQKIRVLAPLFRADLRSHQPLSRAAGFKELVGPLQKEGFVRYAIDAVEKRLDQPVGRGLAAAHGVELVIDRLKVTAASRVRLADAFEEAYRKAHGVAIVRDEQGEEKIFTRLPACPAHDVHLAEEPHPRLFSFNSHLGACETCDGLGRLERCQSSRLLVDPQRPLFEGAMAPPWDRDLEKPHFGIKRILDALARELEIDLDEPFAALPKRARDAILHGHEKPVPVKVVRESQASRREYRFEARWEGLCGHFEKKYRGAEEGKWWRKRLAPLMEEAECSECDGVRLNPLARSFTIGSRRSRARVGLGDLVDLTVEQAAAFFRKLKLTGSRGKVAHEMLQEIQNRVDVLEDVGLGYLQLNRRSATLSGGESQRIRLATQLGNRLVGVLYVLDEPTIGLHARDTQRLIETLKGLQELGNTILVVEHDLDVIAAADHVIDVGPAAGKNGGQVVAEGTLAEVSGHPDSLTGAYLRGDRSIQVPAKRRQIDVPAVTLRKAKLHNLRGIDVTLPLRALTCVTGVSGSGKSTLMMDVLEPAIRAQLDPTRRGEKARGPFSSLRLAAEISHLTVVDQSPLGATPSSNPATYTGIFDVIREVFASTPEARMKGFGKGRFSFNQRGGRCESCEGKGLVQVEMHFLSDVYVPCDACGGRRFDRETLAVTYGGKSIAEVLQMDVTTGLEFFQNHRRIRAPLELLRDVGLGYLGLGQPATTLSGGEAQRVKLASELSSRRAGSCLYFLDEPTTGLHVDDVARLIEVLDRLVDAGNSVVVIEHNPDVIKVADYVLDLGPEGGERGGRLVASGRPEQIARNRSSVTGQRLAREFDNGPSPYLERTA